MAPFRRGEGKGKLGYLGGPHRRTLVWDAGYSLSCLAVTASPVVSRDVSGREITVKAVIQFVPCFVRFAQAVMFLDYATCYLGEERHCTHVRSVISSAKLEWLEVC